MAPLVKLRSFLRNFFSPREAETDLDQELHSHLDLLTQEKIRAGMSPDDAQRAARIELGGIEQVKEQVREERIGNWLQSIISDCRFALRQLRKSPAFTVIAVLTLALGLSVIATMFSFVSAFVLQRPPGGQPDRVAVITSVSPTEDFQSDAIPVSVPNFLAWREANHSFADMAAADEARSVNLMARGEAQAIHSAAVSPNYFGVLRVSPLLGRIFADGEDQPGRDHVVILSQELWERQFASDSSIVGQTVRLNRENYTVIGVMPASFRLLGFTPRLWIPLALTTADKTTTARNDRSLFLFARFKPGATLEQARAEFAALASLAGEKFPEVEKGWGAAVRTLPDFLVYSFGFRHAAALIMAIAGFVLMIACANVAGLLLARTAGRQREMGIRMALGAGRLRIVRQLLTENLLIALFGGALGLLLADWGIHFLRARSTFNEGVSAAPISLDWKVLSFSLIVSLLCAVFCGLAPALNASRTDINADLKEESRGTSSGRRHTRFRTVMVTGQITLALLLLIGTGLLFRGIAEIESQNLGFRPQNLLTANITLDQARYKDASQRSLFVKDLLSRLGQVPGTDAVAAASDLPATWPSQVTVEIRGQAELPANEKLTALDVVVTTEYFHAAGIPLLLGRSFTEMDDAHAPRVILVNQDFVHRLLKDQSPIGQEVRLDIAGSEPAWGEIVGVVGNVKTFSEEARNDPEVYEPFLQRPVPSFSIMLRADSGPDSLASALRNAVAQMDRELPVDRVMSMPALIERQKSGNPLFMRLLATFDFLALLLAAIGIYGLIAYSVSQRTREIGIRIALGAHARDVLGMVLWQGMKMTAAGTVLGLTMAVPLPKVFDSMFYPVRFREPRIYFVMPIVILVVTVLATYIPARRASCVDPVSALRQE